MAISREMLEQLLKRPERMKAEDIVQEDDIGENFKVEEPDSEFDMDEEIEPMTQDLIAKSDKNMAEMPNKKFEASPEVLELVKKLRQVPEGLDTIDVAEETISDPTVSPELRKQAIMKVKQKFLGK
jgi:hypothetical protein